MCACEDFTDSNHMLYEFGTLTLSFDPDNRIETELTDIINVINNIEQTIKIEDKLREKFWNMFIVDALIGNTDRHNGNWGILIDIKSDKRKFAPIYDCGSCLNPMLDDTELENISETEIKNLAINTYSCIKESDKK